MRAQESQREAPFMRNTNKILSASLATMLIIGAAGCGGSDDSAKAGGIYYLNNKPEIAESMKALAKEYTEETGVAFNVQTAASGTYQQSLKSELSKNQPPTLFQVLGQVGLDTWKDYAGDMSDTEIYKQLNDPKLALKSDDDSEVLAVPVVTETYGIIYRKDLLQKYFDMSGASVTSVEEIDNFNTLKTVAEEIQGNKDALGLKGAFASMGFDPSTMWRWSIHLANIPLANEFEKDSITKQPATIHGTYLKQFKNISDLYIQNTTVKATELSGKTMDDALSDINSGEAVFFQNGSWAWPDLVSGGLEAEQVGVLPIYTGVPDEENQGIATGSETFWCVNKQASEESQKATKDFLKWLITSDKGRETWSKTMGFTTPFKTFTGEYATDNPIVQAANDYNEAGKQNVPWAFLYIPTEDWKTNLGNSLLEYAQGTGDWNAVKNSFVDGWASEYEIAQSNK